MIHNTPNAQITQKQMGIIYMQSWKQCALPALRLTLIFPSAWVITKPLWVTTKPFLDSKYFTDIWKTLFNELQSVDENNFDNSVNEIVELLLYSNNKYNLQPNFSVLKSSIKFIVKSKRVVDWRFTSIFLNLSI